MAKNSAKPKKQNAPAVSAPAQVPTAPEGVKTVLHVGCGTSKSILGDKLFKDGEWKELRLDIDPDVKPDVVGDMRDMSIVPEGSVDAVWSSHNIEHVYPHEVIGVIREFYRVLRPGGFVNIATPDLQTVCAPVAEGKLDETLYVSPSGPISPIDVLYGHRRSLAAGRIYMAHHCGFTAISLGKILHSAGFFNIHMQRNGYHLYGYAVKVTDASITKQSGIRISNHNAPKPQAAGQSAPAPSQAPSRGLADELDRPPVLWDA